MPKRDWLGNGVLLAVAVGVVFFLCLCALGVGISEYAKVHEVNAAYQKNAEEDRKRSAEEVAKACERGTSDFRSCVSDHLETYYQDQARNEDLKAQKDMAFWAAALLALGIFQALLSSVGVYLLIDSLAKTSEALDLSREANIISSRNAERELRAYLSVFDFDTTVTNAAITTKITFKNSGQTPARNVRMTSLWASGPEPFPDHLHLSTSTAEGRGSVGPSMPFFGGVSSDEPDAGFQPLTHAQIGEVLAKTKKFWTFGVIEYDDVFGNTHRTRFRYEMNYGRANPGFSPCAEGNDET